MNNSTIYQLEKYEIDIIKKSEEDIKNGRVISQEDLDREDLKWLSKYHLCKNGIKQRIEPYTQTTEKQ